MLFKGCVAFGQEEPANYNYWQADTSEYKKMLDNAVKIIGWYDGKSFLTVRPISDLYDTVRCIMVVTDTAHCYEDNKVIDSLSDTEEGVKVISFHAERLDLGICNELIYTVKVNIQGNIIDGHVCEVEITAEDDFYFDEDGDPEFQECDNCDLPDACCDFGCAIKSGIRKPVEW